MRILPFRLPTQSPWLNPIEPKWVHGKRQVVEPAGVLSAQQLAERICAYFGCPYEPHLVISQQVACSTMAISTRIRTSMLAVCLDYGKLAQQICCYLTQLLGTKGASQTPLSREKAGR